MPEITTAVVAGLYAGVLYVATLGGLLAWLIVRPLDRRDRAERAAGRAPVRFCPTCAADVGTPHQAWCERAGTRELAR